MMAITQRQSPCGITQTAKTNDLEPYTYLRHVLTEPPKADCAENIEALLPLKDKD